LRAVTASRSSGKSFLYFSQAVEAIFRRPFFSSRIEDCGK